MAKATKVTKSVEVVSGYTLELTPTEASTLRTILGSHILDHTSETVYIFNALDRAGVTNNKDVVVVPHEKLYGALEIKERVYGGWEDL